MSRAPGLESLARDDGVSLYVSPRTLRQRLAVSSIGIVVLAARVWADSGFRWAVIAVAGSVILLAVLFVSVTEQRIDVDADGLTIVPLSPLRRAQRFPWETIGSFERRRLGRLSRGAEPTIRAELLGRTRYRYLGFHRRTVDLSAAYSLTPSGPALAIDELLDLLARRGRTA